MYIEQALSKGYIRGLDSPRILLVLCAPLAKLKTIGEITQFKMQLFRFTIAALLAPSLALAIATPQVLKRSPRPIFQNGVYIVDRQTEYTNHVAWNFNGGGLPEGLSVSNYAVNDQRGFSADNVVVRDGYLQLIQSAGSTFPLKGGEVITSVNNIKYASVRTNAVLSETPGTCNGVYHLSSRK